MFRIRDIFFSFFMTDILFRSVFNAAGLFTVNSSTMSDAYVVVTINFFLSQSPPKPSTILCGGHAHNYLSKGIIYLRGGSQNLRALFTGNAHKNNCLIHIANKFYAKKKVYCDARFTSRW